MISRVIRVSLNLLSKVPRLFKREKSIPEKLYRYRSMKVGNETWIRDIFVKCEQYFSRPDEFNDPFDSKIFEIPSTRAQHERHIARLHKDHPEQYEKMLSGETYSQIIDRYGEDNIRELSRNIHEHIRSLIGVLCLSEVKDHILMWSHYSDGHQGFCLEFDYMSYHPSGFAFYEVMYSKIFPSVRTTEMNADEYISAMLTKSDHWQYENEWRAVAHPGIDAGRGLHQYLPETLTGVIFGCEMKPEHKRIIGGWVEEGPTHPKFYQAVKKKNEYGLDIVEYDPNIHDK